jgi:hypothetical protein
MQSDAVGNNFTSQERYKVYAVLRELMRHEFAGEVTMSSFQPAKGLHARLKRTTDAEQHLPRGRALLVIGALSAFSWMVVIGLFMALRAIV